MDDLLDLAVKFEKCSRLKGKLGAADIKEAMHVSLRTVIVKDKEVPLLFDPDKLKVHILDDACSVCNEAHKFPGSAISPKFIADVGTSLRGGALKETLDKK